MMTTLAARAGLFLSHSRIAVAGVSRTRQDVANHIYRRLKERGPAAGVTHVWMHQSLVHAGSSVSPSAVAFCEEHGLNVIAGGCPLMFGTAGDLGHRCMRWAMRLTGRLAA